MLIERIDLNQIDRPMGNDASRRGSYFLRVHVAQAPAVAVAKHDLTSAEKPEHALSVKLTAQFYSPAEIIMVDLDDNRLEMAKRFGATAVVNSTDGQALETVLKLTGNRGVDTAIEAVGIPATFELCEGIVAPGGTIANIGVHGTKVDPSGAPVGPKHHHHHAISRHRQHPDAAQ